MKKVKKTIRFSDYFSLRRTQGQLDFVDIPLETDIRLYVDPYALSVSSVDWLRTCGDLVANYFKLLLDTIRDKDRHEAMRLLSSLHEPNETRLGYSTGKPSGRGWGPKQAGELYNILHSSRAVQSGKLKDLSDFELLVPGIGPDKISDLTTNVIRSELVDYTQEQCELHGVPTENTPAGVFWDPEDAIWESRFAQLPVYAGKGLLLVPKVAVRRRLVANSTDYYTHEVLPFLEAELISAKDSLVYTLKNGDPKVYKRDLRTKYRLTKEFLFHFSNKHPEVLNKYKKTLPEKAEQIIADESIESQQKNARIVDRLALVDEFKKLPRGDENANRYVDLCIAALQQIFHPTLTRPSKEQRVDEGRKRVDIYFVNSASKGFFSRLTNMHKYHAPYIAVECKNYNEDVANPELDQLLGRLNRKRGFIGLLLCRSITDRARLLKRCRDIVNNDEKRLIIVLTDDDMIAMLNFSGKGEARSLEEYMDTKLKEILF